MPCPCPAWGTQACGCFRQTHFVLGLPLSCHRPCFPHYFSRGAWLRMASVLSFCLLSCFGAPCALGPMCPSSWRPKMCGQLSSNARPYRNPFFPASSVTVQLSGPCVEIGYGGVQGMAELCRGFLRHLSAFGDLSELPHCCPPTQLLTPWLLRASSPFPTQQGWPRPDSDLVYLGLDSAKLSAFNALQACPPRGLPGMRGTGRWDSNLSYLTSSPVLLLGH